MWLLLLGIRATAPPATCIVLRLLLVAVLLRIRHLRFPTRLQRKTATINQRRRKVGNAVEQR